MAEYLIQGETLEAIAEAIRAKTGSAELIAVPDMAAQIAGITGGGSDETNPDFCYVTFMSYDGAEEHGKKAVAAGDDCADPIARGIFATPTRESTAQYDFTHIGWATEPNGALDENALKAVTEDRVVYAAYASVLRYYTITYYEEDGTTVLKTESLAYGAMPNYEPEKDGVIFESWTPALATVTGDASYTVVWGEKKALNDYTWEELDAMSVEEVRANFEIGDRKAVVGNSTSIDIWCVELVGIEHDDLADGTGKAKMSFLSLSGWGTATQYGSNAYWPDSNQYSGLLAYCQTGRPSSWSASDADQLKSVVKTVKKEYVSLASSDGYETDFIDVTYWTPSMTELGYSGDVFPIEGSKYPNMTVKTATGTTDTSWPTAAVAHGVRTTNKSNPNSTYIRNSSRVMNSASKTSTAAFCIGFCI